MIPIALDPSIESLDPDLFDRDPEHTSQIDDLPKFRARAPRTDYQAIKATAPGAQGLEYRVEPRQPLLAGRAIATFGTALSSIRILTEETARENLLALSPLLSCFSTV